MAKLFELAGKMLGTRGGPYIVERQVGYRLAQTGVLLLKLLQALRLIDLETAIFPAPAVVTLFRYAQLPAHLSRLPATRSAADQRKRDGAEAPPPGKIQVSKSSRWVSKILSS